MAESKQQGQSMAVAQDDSELSPEELEEVAGGLGDNTNCVEACTTNDSCGKTAGQVF